MGKKYDKKVKWIGSTSPYEFIGEVDTEYHYNANEEIIKIIKTNHFFKKIIKLIRNGAGKIITIDEEVEEL